jgi:hypothetical protein
MFLSFGVDESERNASGGELAHKTESSYPHPSFGGNIVGIWFPRTCRAANQILGSH